jgi:hypothetical protein
MPSSASFAIGVRNPPPSMVIGMPDTGMSKARHNTNTTWSIAGLTAWMDVNSEGIYASRPWIIYGEGPSTTARGGARGAGRGNATPANTSADIRFTTKGSALYAYLLALPTETRAVVKSLATNSPGKKPVKFPCWAITANWSGHRTSNASPSNCRTNCRASTPSPCASKALSRN